MINLIARNNGEPFATELDAKLERTWLGLTHTHEVIQHGGGWVLREKQSGAEQDGSAVTLQPGDYIATEGLSEDDYHAVAEAFMAAGAGKGEYPSDGQFYPYFGWREKIDNLYHGYNGSGWGERQLTLSQILSATNAVGDEPQMTSKQWVPEVGDREEVAEEGYLPIPSPKQCAEDLRDDGFHPQATCVERMMEALEWIARNACQSSRLECQKRASAALATEEDRAVEEMVSHVQASDNFHSFSKRLYQQGYRKQPQPVDDMDDPANWRAGDWIICTTSALQLIKGGRYEILNMVGDNNPVIRNDDGEREERCSGLFEHYSRP